MIYVTGDTHGDFTRVINFCEKHATSRCDDVMIILGDHGANYYGEKESRRFKRLLSTLPLTFVLIRGNHDRRPSPKFHTERPIDTGHIGGVFYVEEEFPSLLHAIDGNTYRFGDKRCFVMGGAFSVDGGYRRAMTKMGQKGYLWFEDEQLSEEELNQCEHTLSQIKAEASEPLTILAHTCPQRFTPVEAFMPGLDQDQIDRTMEIRFDRMFDLLTEGDRWMCGHWHIDKTDGPIRFMMNDIIEL